jgi:RNA polymerase sigma factor (sigma-70 family)
VSAAGDTLGDLVRAARDGDRASLEHLVLSIQDRVHSLALRMLWNPEDAKDATQEILIRIVTRLGTFRGASSFTTWVYRVAANYLLTARKSHLEEQRYTFQRFGQELDESLSDEPASSQQCSTGGDVEPASDGYNPGPCPLQTRRSADVASPSSWPPCSRRPRSSLASSTWSASSRSAARSSRAGRRGSRAGSAA